MTKGRQLILSLLLINSWDHIARTSTCSAAEISVQSWEESLTLLQLYTRPSSQPLSRLIELRRGAALRAAVPQVKKPPEERGVENKSPCHFHSLVISSAVPTEAEGAPGDRRNGREQPGQPMGAAVPARQARPGHHSQSARHGPSGPKGTG